jgi:hypothetical protein
MRPRSEQDVAARPVAGRACKKILTILFQLALALLDRHLCHGQLGGFLGPTLSLPFPVAAILLTPQFLAARRRAVATGRMPALPVPGSFLASFATITTEWMSRPEQLLALLQQAATQPSAARVLKRAIG